MKASIRLAMSLSLALTALALAGCNDSGVVAAPAATPSPTPTPADPLAPIAIIDSGSPIYDTQDTATFDGWLSYDPDGYITTYSWAVLTKPAGSNAQLTADTLDGSTSTLFVDQAGDYSIQLTVTDDTGLTGTTTYQFSATVSSLHVQLSWPGQYGDVDMDLHMINTTGTTPAPALWDNAYDCHWRNCKPSEGENLEWGIAGDATDNPRLDIDNISSAVPENMNIQTPQNGTYRVAVHYYGSHTGSDIDVNANVKVYLGTVLVYDSAATISNTDDVWTVGDINWAGGNGTFAVINSMGTTSFNGF